MPISPLMRPVYTGFAVLFNSGASDSHNRTDLFTKFTIVSAPLEYITPRVTSAFQCKTLDFLSFVP